VLWMRKRNVGPPGSGSRKDGRRRVSTTAVMHIAVATVTTVAMATVPMDTVARRRSARRRSAQRSPHPVDRNLALPGPLGQGIPAPFARRIYGKLGP
jgi:hypothetical protein